MRCDCWCTLESNGDVGEIEIDCGGKVEEVKLGRLSLEVECLFLANTLDQVTVLEMRRID